MRGKAQGGEGAEGPRTAPSTDAAGGRGRARSTLLDSAAERLPRWIAGVSVAAVLASLVAAQVRFAAGLAVGSGVALLGYWWLHRGIQAALNAGRAPVTVFLKLALRYPLAIGAVLLFYRTGLLPASAVMAGLFAPLAGLLAESLAIAVHALRARVTVETPGVQLH